MKYYKINDDFVCKNIEFKNCSLYFIDGFFAGRKYTVNSIHVTNVKNIKEITEKEYLDFNNPKFTVVLNNEYTAEVTKDNIKVGCQLFPHSIVKDLQEALDKIKA